LEDEISGEAQRAIAKHSQQVGSRKAGHVEDYAPENGCQCWATPEVQAHPQEQERARQVQRSRDRDGPGMSR